MTASLTRHCSDALLQFIDQSPSPWHAVATARQQLVQQGYVELQETDKWSLQQGKAYFVTRDGSSLIAFIVGNQCIEKGFRLIGAHTDSPGLRIKTNGAHDRDGYTRLATEIYGGPILATFSDRDLLLAGRALIRDTSAPNDTRMQLLRLDNALVRLPNLAIHLNRTVNDDGLKLHKHNGLNLLWGIGQPEQQASAFWRQLIAQQLGITESNLLAIELGAVDAQSPAYFGLNQEFIAARQLDNLASCHAALQALLHTSINDTGAMIALFDHEEVGSESLVGAAGNFLESTLQRIALSLDSASDSLARLCANSWHMSADMAHAHHPAHADCFDSLHQLKINAGVVLKMNASQRYATNGLGEAFFSQLCEKAGVPSQKYVHRADLACGTTIGPVAAARLGIKTFDVGSAMWAMHSARESAGAHDHLHYINFMKAFLN